MKGEKRGPRQTAHLSKSGPMMVMVGEMPPTAINISFCKRDQKRRADVRQSSEVV